MLICDRSCKRVRVLTILAAALLAPAVAGAAYDPADVRTTTRFGPPTEFGVTFRPSGRRH